MKCSVLSLMPYKRLERLLVQPVSDTITHNLQRIPDVSLVPARLWKPAYKTFNFGRSLSGKARPSSFTVYRQGYLKNTWGREVIFHSS